MTAQAAMVKKEMKKQKLEMEKSRPQVINARIAMVGESQSCMVLKSVRHQGFTGVDAPYEAPERPDIHIENAGKTVDECVQLVQITRHARSHSVGKSQSCMVYR